MASQMPSAPIPGERERSSPATRADFDAAVTDHRLLTPPWYLSVGDEVEVFLAAYAARLPVLLKGPTGCGKTRFVEYVTWRLYRGNGPPRRRLEEPLVTVACHEDLTGTDLVGRYLLERDETVWMTARSRARSARARSATWTRSSRRARTRRCSSTP